MGSALEPVITRDEFARTKHRGAVYAALHGLEDELSSALDSVLVAQADESLAELEDMLQLSLAKVAKTDASLLVQGLQRLESSTEAEAEADEGPSPTLQSTPTTVDGASIKPIRRETVPGTMGERASTPSRASTRQRTAIHLVHADSNDDGPPRRAYSAGRLRRNHSFSHSVRGVY